MSVALASPSPTITLGDLIPLPGYGPAARRLEETYSHYRVFHLYRAIFQQDPPDDNDPTEAFAVRVNDELFDINLDYMAEIYYSVGDNPLDYPIYFTGYRLPWEACSVWELAPYQQPLAAWLGAWEFDDPVDVWEYCDSHDIDLQSAPPPPDDDAARRAVVERLARQPEPFNALADLLGAAWDIDVQSIFMLASDQAWEEYVPRDLLFWTPDDVRYLAGQYNLARPALARIFAYIAWFDAAEGAGDEFCPHRATIDVLREALNAA